MDNLVVFFEQYGAAVTLIALAGIAILGILKYFNVFKNFSETKRHYLYIVISVGLSAIGTGIYFGVNGEFTMSAWLAVTVAIYALNQAFYSLFKVTPINELGETVLEFVVGLFKKDTTAEVETKTENETEEKTE